MVEIMARGVTIDQALDQARKDPIVKERHCVAALAISATTGKRSAPSYDPVLAGAPMAKKPKGPKVSKGKGKGNQRGRRRASQPGRSVHLPPQTGRRSASASTTSPRGAPGSSAHSCVCAAGVSGTVHCSGAMPEGAPAGAVVEPR